MKKHFSHSPGYKADMTAIITDVHYRMSLALIRDLGEAGISVTACERESFSNPPGFYSKYVNRAEILSDENYISDLYGLCEKICSETGEKPVLLPVGRETLADLSDKNVYLKFSEVSRMCLPDSDMLEKFNNKKMSAELAKELFIPVPTSYSDTDFQNLPLPAVVKPAFGEKFGISAKDRYAVAETPDEVKTAYENFFKITGEAPIIQEYLEGDGFGCSVIAKNGEIITSLCHKRIREYPVSGGPSSCCISENIPSLNDYAAKMVKAVSYTGIAMFEFKSNKKGELFLLEVNPRMWGSFPLARAAKSELSLCWYRAAYGFDFSGYRVKPGKNGKKMKFSASDMTAMFGYIRKGKIKKALSALADNLNPLVSDGVWEWRDPKPGIEYYKSIFRKGKR